MSMIGADDVEFVGVSLFSRSLPGILANYSRSNAPVLICGETGTGKSILAYKLHALSGRAPSSLARFFCTTTPETLFESMLLGHTKGAFTGAQTDSQGLISLARGGTLWLDEIGDLTLACQSKLLGIYDGHYRPVGAKREERVEARLLAATNKDLEAAVEAGQFRLDLYHRIAVLQITIPPLRKRPEDIVPLLEDFVRNARRQVRADIRLELDEPSLKALSAHRWPGNVRELQNLATWALAESGGVAVSSFAMASALGIKWAETLFPAVLDARDFQGRDQALLSTRYSREERSFSNLGLARSEQPVLQPFVEPAASGLGAAEETAFRTWADLALWAQQREKRMIKQALDDCGWARTKAAELLRLDYKALLYRAKMYGLPFDQEVQGHHAKPHRFSPGMYISEVNAEFQAKARQMIRQALTLTFSNRRKAAANLGLSYKSLLYWMQKLDFVQKRKKCASKSSPVSP